MDSLEFYIVKRCEMDLATRTKINYFKTATLQKWEFKSIRKFCIKEYRNMWKSKKPSERDKAYSETMDYYKEVAKVAKVRLKDIGVA